MATAQRPRPHTRWNLPTDQASRLLLVARCDNWGGFARMPRALHQAGFEVAVLCYPEALIAKSRFVRWFYRFRGPAHTTREFCGLLAQAIEDFRPAMVLPGDDPSIHSLHSALGEPDIRSRLSPSVLKVLRRSLPPTGRMESTFNKNATLRAAQRLGLRTPAQVSAPSVGVALEFRNQWQDRPVVLKSPRGWSGLGVRICATDTEIREAYEELTRLHLLEEPEVGALPESADERTLRTLSVQQFVVGPAAIYSAVALDGEILAGYGVYKETVHPEPAGPGASVRFTDHPEMEATARAMARHTRFNGFLEFCFVIERETRHAYLLECNPRPAPIASIGHYIGVDLATYFHQALHGNPSRPRPKRTPDVTVALFPAEFQRCPTNPLLRTPYHDVPWDDPALLKAML